MYSRNQVFRDQHHLASFEHLVQAKYSAKVFVNDRNSEQVRSMYPRSGGVATILHCDLAGSSSAQVEEPLTIPNRYLVVKLECGSVPIYIHNVYAPNAPAAKKTFSRVSRPSLIWTRSILFVVISILR